MVTREVILIKRLTILLTVLLVIVSVVPVYAGWTTNQTKANQMANIARSMGLSESNPIIVEASRIWWEEQNKVVAQVAQQTNYDAGLQNFLNQHYSDARAMAGTMFAEARGLDKREMSMVAWTILNRWDSGRFGGTLSSVIWAKSQFAHSNRTVSDNGTDLVALANDVLTRWYKEKNGATNVGRTLPAGYYFYYGDGRHNYFRKTNSGKGAYNFGLPNPY